MDKHSTSWGASLVVQGLGLHLLVQGVWVWSLVRELSPTHHGVQPKILKNLYLMVVAIFLLSDFHQIRFLLWYQLISKSAQIVSSFFFLCPFFFLPSCLICKIYFRNYSLGSSLVVQWLTLCTSSLGDLGSIPDQETRSHMPELRLGAVKINK